MSSAEVLEILYEHGFSIMTNSTNYRSTIKLQKYILLRNKESQYPAHNKIRVYQFTVGHKPFSRF